MRSSPGPRILTVIASVTMILAGLGFVASLPLNAFVFDEYDAYGEVPIPGQGRVELPAGEVTVSFHTVLVGGGGAGLPVPPLRYRMTGPGGVDVQLVEDYGSTTIRRLAATERLRLRRVRRLRRGADPRTGPGGTARR